MSAFFWMALNCFHVDFIELKVMGDGKLKMRYGLDSASLLGRDDALPYILELVERVSNPLDVGVLWVQFEKIVEELLGVWILGRASAFYRTTAFASASSSFSSWTFFRTASSSSKS